VSGESYVSTYGIHGGEETVSGLLQHESGEGSALCAVLH